MSNVVTFLPMDKFPNRLRHFRKARGWTLEYVALEIGTSIPQVSLLEKGQRALTQVWMRKFATLFAVTPGELLPNDENAFNLSPEERLWIERYRSASPETQKTFDRVSDAILPYSAEPHYDQCEHSNRRTG